MARVLAAALIAVALSPGVGAAVDGGGVVVGRKRVAVAFGNAPHNDVARIVGLATRSLIRGPLTITLTDGGGPLARRDTFRSPCPNRRSGRRRFAGEESRTARGMARRGATSSSAAGASAAVSWGRIVGGGAFPPLSGLSPFETGALKVVWTAVSGAVNVAEVLPLILVSVGAVPLARAANSLFAASKEDAETEENDEGEESSLGGEGEEESSPVGGDDAFKGTYLYEAASHLSQASRIGTVLYALHVFLVGLAAGGVSWADRDLSYLSRASARVMYTVWAALRVSYFKRRFLARAAEQDPNELGRARVYNRALNYLIYGVAAFFVLDALAIPMGMGLRSIITAGGIGSVVFGLASKELASQLVSGFALSAGQKFFDGDKIVLGDGTSGKVMKVGALATEIRGSDETIIRIPNSQIVNQRVSNLSRQDMSRVKQTLRFSYDDIKKLPILMKEIKFQIQQSCSPHLVTEGRPFRAHLHDFKDDHVECVVQCHFRLKPTGDPYCDNRERVLRAIAKAAEKHGVEFAVPTSYNKNEVVTPKPTPYGPAKRLSE